jgi:hypothetical protein
MAFWDPIVNFFNRPLTPNERQAKIALGEDPDQSFLSGLWGAAQQGLLGTGGTPGMVAKVGGTKTLLNPLLGGLGRFVRGSPLKALGIGAAGIAGGWGFLDKLRGGGPAQGSLPPGFLQSLAQGNMAGGTQAGLNPLLAQAYQSAMSGTDIGPQRDAFLKQVEAARSGLRADLSRIVGDIEARESVGIKSANTLGDTLRAQLSQERAGLSDIESSSREALGRYDQSFMGADTLAPFEAAMTSEGEVNSDVALLREAAAEQARSRVSKARGMEASGLSELAGQQAAGLAQLAAAQQQAELQRAQFLMGLSQLTQQQNPLANLRFGPNVISGLRGAAFDPSYVKRLISNTPERRVAGVQNIIQGKIEDNPAIASDPAALAQNVMQDETARKFPALTSLLLSQYLQYGLPAQ